MDLRLSRYRTMGVKGCFYFMFVCLLTVGYFQGTCGYIVCDKYGIRGAVSEQQPIDYEVYDLNSNCRDTNGKPLDYDLINGNTYEKFKIVDGKLKLNKQLNADGTFKFDMRVSVTLAETSQFTTTVTFAIRAVQANDNAPSIEIPTAINIYESVQLGTKLIDCTLRDKDYKANLVGTDAGLTGAVRTRIINQEGKDNFEIDDEQCLIYLDTVLDYEVKQSYLVTVEAYDLALAEPKTTTVNVTVNIVDVNDNSPSCVDTFKSLVIEEAKPVETDITLIDCTDIDSGVFGTIGVKISDNNPAISKDKFDIGETAGKYYLRVKGTLDYEEQIEYKVNVDVFDGGSPAKTTTVIYSILLSDIDDNKPTFSASVINGGSITENAPQGTIVYTVTATDIDAPNSPASTIVYGILPSSPDWFSVHPETGAIFVNNSIDWLVAPSVNLSIFAYSSDKVAERNTVTVMITIIDENNIAPSFDQVYYQVNVEENTPDATQVITVKATDLEAGLNGEITYNINSAVFSIDPDTGVVTTKAPIDYEVNTVHSLSIEASDKGNPKQTGYAFLLVNVLPVNEFPPVLTGPASSLNTPEDTPPGTVIYTLSATDQDSGNDGLISFSIANTTLPFAIDPQTGDLSVKNTLDRETKAQWTIEVIASDNSDDGAARKSASVNVVVDVTDVNDNDPICEPLSTVTLVPSTGHVGMTLATINCTDVDETSQLKFRKLSGDVNDVFSVDLTSGVITLAKLPTESDYTVTIAVEDALNQVEVIFSVIAEFQFEFPNLPATLDFVENTARGSQLHEVEVCCVSGSIEYTISSGNEDGVMILDPSDGRLFLIKEFDYESKTEYSLNIKATSVTTGLTKNETLTIKVTDVNDVTPTFSTSFHSQSVSENFEVNKQVIAVTATDTEQGVNGEIVYSIVSGNDEGKFKLEQNGVISLLSLLDAETTRLYKLVVEAKDKGISPLSSQTQIIIEVKDVNEFTPQLVNVTNGVVTTGISENTALGALILEFRAKDGDVNTVLTYAITGGNDDITFSIDSNTGDIHLLKSLDREKVDQHNLTVVVTATGEADVSAIVVINVLDANDMDPVFEKKTYEFEVQHELAMDSVVHVFSITDGDIGVNADIISVSIDSGDPTNQFKTDGKELRTNKQVDYYALDKMFSLIVTATDGGNPARSNFAIVIIKVLPKFKPPKFITTNYEVNAAEDMSVNSLVFQMHATSEGATQLQYSILNNDTDAFYISDSTGMVKLSRNLDFETSENHVLIIGAKSKEDPRLTASATLTVNVDNVNDHYPVFSQVKYSFVVKENVSVPHLVGTVQAVDLDKSPYGTVSYSLGTATGSSDFSVSNSGQLSVINGLDFGRQNIYVLSVVASDSVRKGYAVVTVNVIDVNNNSPKFPSAAVSINVLETVGAGQVFYTARAQDADWDSNGLIKYSLSPTSSQFSIDEDTGALSTSSALDRESVALYDLVILAIDQPTDGIGALTGTLSLTVNVLDANDNQPKFDSPSASVTISRAGLPGTQVSTFTASDKDSGLNAEIEYSLENSKGIFLINSTSGEIKTALDLAAADNFYKTKVIARDRGTPTNSATMDLMIQINPPKPVDPSSSEQTMSTTENLPSGTSIGFVAPDPTFSAPLEFSFLGGNSQNFRLDKDTGEISTVNPLDREDVATHILVIGVKDSSNNEETKVVRVNVQDVNDNAPVILTFDSSPQVVENTPAGQIVTRFTITDPDDGVNAEWDLSLPNFPPVVTKYLELDGNILKVKEPLDFELIQSITFNIMAVDRGNPKQSGSAQISVNVIDVNDKVTLTGTPEEAPSVYIPKETSYNAVIGDKATRVTPEDFNITLTTGTISYTSLSSEGIFAVDATGNVTVQKPDLLEPGQSYYMWIVASTENNGEDTNLLGLLRIDTFDPNKHLISLESTSDVNTVIANKDDILQKLTAMHTNADVPKIWKIQKLPNGRTQVLAYVIDGPMSTTISDIEEGRTFKDASTLLSNYRQTPGDEAAKPALGPIIEYVNGYSEDLLRPTASAVKEEEFATSTQGLVTFAMLSIILTLVVIGLIIFFIYKKKKRDRERSDSSENLMPKEPEKKARKLDIVKPVGKGKKKDNVDPEAPDRNLRRTSIGPASTSLPKIKTKNKKNKNKKTVTHSLAAEAELPPVQDPTGMDKSNMSNIGVSPVVSKGTVSQRGKVYDGKAIDPETNEPYLYNTRTGSTLWVEKNNSMGAAKGKNGKKKAAPMLTVVSEAKNTTPSFNLDRRN